MVGTGRHQPRSQGEGFSEIWEPDHSTAFLNTKREVSPITEKFHQIQECADVMKSHSSRKAAAIKVQSYTHLKSDLPSSRPGSDMGQRWKKTRISKDTWTGPGGGSMKENEACKSQPVSHIPG